jgi:hypothetical protein
MMIQYKVGEKHQEFADGTEGVYFAIDTSGFIMTVKFNSPTTKERDEFKSEKPFSIKLLEISGIIIVLVKFGSLNWMDAPFSPWLGNKAIFLGHIPEGAGYGLTIMLIDSKSGEILSLRLIGLNQRLSEEFRKMVYSAPKLTREEYDKAVSNVFKHTTNQLVKMSNIYYKE